MFNLGSKVYTLMISTCLATATIVATIFAAFTYHNLAWIGLALLIAILLGYTIVQSAKVLVADMRHIILKLNTAEQMLVSRNTHSEFVEEVKRREEL